MFAHNFSLLDEGLRALRRIQKGKKKKKLLHLHSSILTSRLISAQGHQYFWHFSGGINIEWIPPFVVKQGAAYLRASTEICLLAHSVGWPACLQSLQTVFYCFLHHKLVPIWVIELWKRSDLKVETRNQPDGWAMSSSGGLGWNIYKFILGLFLSNSCDGLI